MKKELVSCPKCGGTKFMLYKLIDKGKTKEVVPECVLCKQAEELDKVRDGL